MSGIVGTIRKVNPARAFYLVVLLAGIILYLVWSIIYNAWFDIGLYSIVIIMLAFGFFGYLLYTIAPHGGKK